MLTNLFLRFAYAGSEWIMWVLVALSFVSVALIVDRIVYFVKNKVDIEDLMNQLRQALKDGNLRAAWSLVAERPQIEYQVVAEGIKAIQRGPDACHEAMQTARSRDKNRVDANVSYLATIGSNAPFVGLLGTVLGIITAARDLSESGAGAGAVMTGVFEALVATAVGLLVAIPAIVAYNIFSKKARQTLGQVDTLSHFLLSQIRPEWTLAGQNSRPATQTTNDRTPVAAGR